MNGKKKKPDLLTIVLYAVIVIVLLYLAAGLGATVDLARDDKGALDFNVFGEIFEKTLTDTNAVFAALSDTNGTSLKLTFFTAFGIGIYALLKITSRKRLHRKGVEHGSARLGGQRQKRKRLFAIRTKKERS